MAGERPKPLNEDIALLFGALLAGAGVKGLTGEFDSWVMLIIGAWLILGVGYRRVRDARPPWVKGDLGIRILKQTFVDSSVTFMAALRPPLDGADLWITCDAQVVDGQATVRQSLDGGRRAVDDWPIYPYGKVAFVWLSKEPPDGKPYLKDDKEVEVRLTATWPLRRVKVAIASPRQRGQLVKKLAAQSSMRSVDLRPPTVSEQAPPS